MVFGHQEFVPPDREMGLLHETLVMRKTSGPGCQVWIQDGILVKVSYPRKPSGRE